MWCTICATPIALCKCDDIEERLKSAAEAMGSKFVYRYCKKCNRHYDKCFCKAPEWGIRGAEKKIKGEIK